MCSAKPSRLRLLKVWWGDVRASIPLDEIWWYVCLTVELLPNAVQPLLDCLLTAHALAIKPRQDTAWNLFYVCVGSVLCLCGMALRVDVVLLHHNIK